MAMRQPRMPFTSATDWTVDMLDALPDDGQRHEIIDGVPFVSPAPSTMHQAVVGALHSVLDAYLRQGAVGHAYVAPIDVRRGDRQRNRVQPDVLAVRLVDDHDPPYPFDQSDLLLAIEVESPANRLYDHETKREEYLSHGVTEYWFVSPAERTVTRWRSIRDPGDVLANIIAWHPAGMPTPLTIDLPAFFERALKYV